MHDTSSGQLLSNINTRPLHWLWPQRVPLAHLSILYGQPGSGLSLIALHLVSCVSSGRTLPDDLPCPQGNVISFSSSSASADPESVRSILRQLILDILQDSPEPVTAQELSQCIPYAYDNIRKTLQRMVPSGELISPARGLYTLPPSPATNSVPTVPTVPIVPN